MRWHPLLGRYKVKLWWFYLLDRATTVFVLWNSEGWVIGAGAFNLDKVTIAVVEAMGLREGLGFAKRKGFQNIMVKGDSKLIVCVVQEKWDVPWN